MPKVTDQRLLIPGWPGSLDQDEFEFVRDELLKDKKLSLFWGFIPSRKRRQEWAVRQVAMWGNPDDVRGTNKVLARQQFPAGSQFSTEAPEPLLTTKSGGLKLWQVQ